MSSSVLLIKIGTCPQESWRPVRGIEYFVAVKLEEMRFERAANAVDGIRFVSGVEWVAPLREPAKRFSPSAGKRKCY